MAEPIVQMQDDAAAGIDGEVYRRLTVGSGTSESATIKSGRLTKQSGGDGTLFPTNWRKRFFMLTRNLLAYLDREGGVIKGGVLLEGALGVRKALPKEAGKHRSCFIVETNDRNYAISADSDNDRDSWISAIASAIDALKKPKAAASGAVRSEPTKATSSAPAPVLVLGATGQVGAAVVLALAARGVKTRCGVRNPASEKAMSLAALDGVTVVKGHLGEPSTLAAAMEGVSCLFINTPGAEDREALVAAGVDAAKAAGVPHVVVVSVNSVASAGTDLIFKSQFSAIESKLAESGLQHTILRLPMFMDNQWASQDSIKNQGKIYGPVDGSKPVYPVCVADAGEASATVLTAPAAHAGKTYMLAAEPTSFTEIASLFAAATGQDVDYIRVPYSAARESMVGMGQPEWMTDGVLQLFKMIDDDEDAVQVPRGTADLEALLGRTPTSMATWITQVGGAFKPEAKLTVYYWPMMGRAGSLFRMLNEAALPYEHKSPMDDQVCAAFGAETGTFAPPVVKDGDFLINQSTAASLYVGSQCGFVPDSLNPFLAAKYMADIQDFFENGLGNNYDDSKKLFDFLEGERFTKMFSCVERCIEGPFFFGNDKSYVDFFLCQHWDWAHTFCLDMLEKKTGKEYFAPFPKIKAAVAGIHELASYKDLTGTPVEGRETSRSGFYVKQAVIDAYGESQ